MTTAIIVLLVLAAIAAVFREFVWIDRMKEQGWRHNDRVRSLEARNAELEADNEDLEAWGRESITAVTEATKMVAEANARVKAATSG